MIAGSGGACGEQWRIQAVRVCSQGLLLDNDRRPGLISSLTLNRTACSFLLSLSVAFARKLSFCLFFRTWPREEQGGPKLPCSANHTQYKGAVCEALPWRGRLCARCRCSVAGRRLPDPPQSRSNENTSEWGRCALWTRFVLSGPGLLLHATKLFFVDVLIHGRLSLGWIAAIVTSSDAISL